MPPGPERPLFGKASKKPLNSEQVLVSRKAMQNYNRFLEQANIFTTFFQKKAVFLRFAWFRTPEGWFRTATSAPQPAFFNVAADGFHCCGTAMHRTRGNGWHRGEERQPEGRERQPEERKGTRREGKVPRLEGRHLREGMATEWSGGSRLRARVHYVIIVFFERFFNLCVIILIVTE